MSQPSNISAPQEYTKRPGATRNVAISFVGQLDGDEELDGMPTAASVPSGLVITDVEITSATRRINGVQVPAGKAITCKVAGGTLDTDYEIVPTCDSTGGQTLEGVCRMRIRAR